MNQSKLLRKSYHTALFDTYILVQKRLCFQTTSNNKFSAQNCLTNYWHRGKLLRKSYHTALFDTYILVQKRLCFQTASNNKFSAQNCLTNYWHRGFAIPLLLTYLAVTKLRRQDADSGAFTFIRSAWFKLVRRKIFQTIDSTGLSDFGSPRRQTITLKHRVLR
jgi:hypothetical protein